MSLRSTSFCAFSLNSLHSRANHHPQLEVTHSSKPGERQQGEFGYHHWLCSWVRPRGVVAVGEGAGTGPAVSAGIMPQQTGKGMLVYQMSCWPLFGRVPCFPPTPSHSLLTQFISANKNPLTADNELGWSFVMTTRWREV